MHSGSSISVWNAGVPDSASVQEVIFWQGRTIQMMYHIIGQAMRDAGVKDQHPRDYLAFYCLGTVLFANSASPPVHVCHEKTLSAAEAAHLCWDTESRGEFGREGYVWGCERGGFGGWVGRFSISGSTLM